MGQKKISSTEVYARIVDEKKEEAIALLPTVSSNLYGETEKSITLPSLYFFLLQPPQLPSQYPQNSPSTFPHHPHVIIVTKRRVGKLPLREPWKLFFLEGFATLQHIRNPQEVTFHSSCRVGPFS